MKKRKEKDDIQLLKQIRVDWGTIKPYTRKFKSKKDYNRKDKSYLKTLDNE